MLHRHRMRVPAAPSSPRPHNPRDESDSIAMELAEAAAEAWHRGRYARAAQLRADLAHSGYPGLLHEGRP